ncbi:hypothetical protein [Plantactinospora sp. BC1]|uniref:hypothetical protein n=1 Tax=Plantactinospora sp. BC1 TaxID=2108470 RepID=UPI00131EDB80|nr:hypothetical protein [Plantactinospora sp. BC1]
MELYLWDSGERSESATSLARQLKDRISRALNGLSLSAQTLQWIIDAFGMDQNDQERLWEVFSGRAGHGGGGISHTLRRRREMIRRQCHRTVSLVERYTVGPDGAMLFRRTLHTIRAIEDGVDIYIFNHEPEADKIDVMHGGRIGRRYEYGEGLHSAEIILDSALLKFESTALEYRAHFTQGVSRLSEVRRTAFARVENIDMAVEFQGAAPRDAWWCVWDDQIGGTLVEEERTEIRNGIVRKYIPFIEETVTGFRWQW